MWPNHASYLAPRLEQGKAISKGCGEAQITGKPLHFPVWPREGETPEFPYTPGRSQEQSCMVASGQQASDIHAAFTICQDDAGRE